MYRLCLFLFSQLLILNSSKSFSQPGEWVWIHGSPGPNSGGNHGTKGVPSPTNEPPAMYEPCEWTDLNGNYWIYGGLSPNINIYSDLWKYDPVTNEWTWVFGTNSFNDPGNYGTQGVASPSNRPPARCYGVPSWVDLNGNLWMFGGNKITGGALNDLWKYDISINQWTWMKGPNTSNQPDVYGTRGVPDIANTPGSRWECPTAWTDNAGDLWLFGGLSYGSYSDLWRYNIATNTWTWMKGPDVTDQTGRYGTQGVEDTSNVPSYRHAHCRWKDNNGNLWLYGGVNGYNYKVYDDLWRYNISTGNWTWMSGDSVVGAAGLYGTKCTTSSFSKPGLREENRAAWTDTYGNLWMFGGSSDAFGQSPMNDLWMYCVSNNRWTWMGGDSTANATGNWGTKNVSNPANKPSGRSGSVGWTDHKGHLYMFGGTAAIISTFVPYNDLWKFTIDPCCSSCNPTSLVASFQADDTTLCFGACSNFTDNTLNATSWQWLFPGGYPSSGTGQNPPSICYYDSGRFDVTLIVSISSSCASVDTLTKTNYIQVYSSPPTPSITQSYDTLFCSTDPSYVSYQWYYNSNPVLGATDTLFLHAQTGNYNLKVTDIHGCSIAVGINIVGLGKFSDNPEFSLFPNPVRDRFTVYGLRSAVTHADIYNVLGEVLMHVPLNWRGSRGEADVSALAAGIYFVVLTNENGRWAGKFVKE